MPLFTHPEHFGSSRLHFDFEFVHGQQLFCRRLNFGLGEQRFEWRTNEDSVLY
jgi:hypothetical protein